MRALASTALFSLAASEAANPLQKTLELISGLQNRIHQQGEKEESAFSEYHAFCSASSKQSSYEIKTAKSDQNHLEASIADATSSIEHANGIIADVVSKISAHEKQLKDASKLRNREREEFEASESELMQALDMLGRAMETLERAADGGAVLLQEKGNAETLQDVLFGIASVVDAAGFISESDKTKLLAFIQSTDTDAQPQQTREAYETKSQGIVAVMENLRDKAAGQLRKAREEEETAMHNFKMIEMSLEDSIKDSNTELLDVKDELASTQESKATNGGKLVVTKGLLKDAEESLKQTQYDCVHTAADHETTVQGRERELENLGKVVDMLRDVMSGSSANEQTYGDDSFFQLHLQAEEVRRHRRGGKVPFRGSEAVSLLTRLASDEKDRGIANLASQVKAEMRFSFLGSKADPFVKVKKMIKEMVAKLEREARDEAQEKAYCDKEIAVTKLKKAQLEDDLSGMEAHANKAECESAQLKEEAKMLQEDLAALAKLQEEMDKSRAAAKASYQEAVDNLNYGINGVRAALGALKDFYGTAEEAAAAAAAGASFLQVHRARRLDSEFGEKEAADVLESLSDNDGDVSLEQQPAAPEKHEDSKGAGGALIGLLEVVSSDMAKNLAQEEAEESNAEQEYDAETQENKVTQASKERDVELKTKQYISMDKDIGSRDADLRTSNEELVAVRDYWAKIQSRCTAKPELYEEKKERLEREIKGLEEAKSIIAAQNSFLQKRSF